MGDTRGDGSILSVSSRALLTACEGLGIDTTAMLRSAEVNRATVEDPDGRIPSYKMAKLWEQAYALSGDPQLALHAVERLPFGAYKVIDFLASNAPTMGESLRKVCEYCPIINPAVELSLEVGDDRVTMMMNGPADPGAVPSSYAEYTLAAIFLRCREASGIPWRLHLVTFAHEAPHNTTEHERIFGCPVRFGADAIQLVIDNTMWDYPIRRADSTLFEVLDQHAFVLTEQAPKATSLVDRVRETASKVLPGGDATLESVAQSLAMSPRTLQRRLKDEGMHYADILDGLRATSAKAYLKDPEVAISEVAYLLGFAESSSFNRAFRRWTRTSPSEYRNRLAS
jgi:AraC-like DNA-binding protein